MEKTAPSLLETIQQLDRTQIPRHVAFIMDGNGRWAQQRGLPRIEGHRLGVETVRNVVETATELKLDQITLYCFSSENWKRPQIELDFLMALLCQFLILERPMILEQGLQFRVIGRIDELDEEVIQEIETTKSLTVNNTGTTLCLAINYGSRSEIVDAFKKMALNIEQGITKSDDISEELISSHLYTAGMPDPDLVIRTAGEMRLSNFLLWQMSYAEFYVTEKFWPEFREEDFYQAIYNYSQRDRRFGGLKN
jgi:undecaprenyl diphosphate synthase